MTDPIIEDDFDNSFPSLGPGYYSARRFAENYLQGAEPDIFKPVIDKLAKDLADEVWERVQDNLISDHNVQNHVWQTVDQIVRYLIDGEAWAIERYALQSRYDDGVRARKAIAEHIPKELQDARIKDLEAENAKLRDEIRWLRR